LKQQPGDWLLDLKGIKGRLPWRASVVLFIDGGDSAGSNV